MKSLAFIEISGINWRGVDLAVNDELNVVLGISYINLHRCAIIVPYIPI